MNVKKTYWWTIFQQEKLRGYIEQEEYFSKGICGYVKRISSTYSWLYQMTTQFNINASLAIERALNINIEGFFMKIQTNHDIYYVMAQERAIHSDLTKISKSLFWNTKIEMINWVRNKDLVIQLIPKIKDIWKKTTSSFSYYHWLYVSYAHHYVL